MFNQDTMTDEAMADLYARRNDRQVYATEVRTKPRLGKTTWVLGEEPIKTLLWCDRGAPRVGKVKPAKVNGIVLPL